MQLSLLLARLDATAGGRTLREYGRWFLFAVGGLTVVVGLADVTSRLAGGVLGPDAARTAFGPAAALGTSAFGTSTPATPIIPVRVKIPMLGVNAAVEEVSVKADGTMEAPKDFAKVGWYELGAKPGGPGSAVFAGHVNNALTQAGVFQHLSDIKLGDYITVEDASGRALVYRVTETNEYSANPETPSEAAPMDRLFATVGPSQIVLITCDGDWVPSERSFDKRFVAIAKLVQ